MMSCCRWVTEMFTWPTHGQIPLAGTLGWFCGMVMLISSMSFIRRRFYSVSSTFKLQVMSTSLTNFIGWRFCSISSTIELLVKSLCSMWFIRRRFYLVSPTFHLLQLPLLFQSCHLLEVTLAWTCWPASAMKSWLRRLLTNRSAH